MNEIFVEIQKVIKIEQYGQGLPMLNGKKVIKIKIKGINYKRDQHNIKYTRISKTILTNIKKLTLSGS